MSNHYLNKVYHFILLFAFLFFANHLVAQNKTTTYPKEKPLPIELPALETPDEAIELPHPIPSNRVRLVYPFMKSPEKYRCIESGGKYGISTKDGDVLIYPQYDHIYRVVQEGLFSVQRINKWGAINEEAINTKGEIVVPFEKERMRWAE